MSTPANEVQAAMQVATEAATVGAVASGNPQLVPAIDTAAALAQMLQSTITLAQSGHFTAADWASVQTAFGNAVARWNAA